MPNPENRTLTFSIFRHNPYDPESKPRMEDFVLEEDEEPDTGMEILKYISVVLVIIFVIIILKAGKKKEPEDDL